MIKHFRGLINHVVDWALLFWENLFIFELSMENQDPDSPNKKKEKIPARLVQQKIIVHQQQMGSLLLYSELTEEEHLFLAKRQIATAKEQQKDFFDVYAEVLFEFGVMCPHPQHKRSYRRTPGDMPLWFECACCCALVPTRFAPFGTPKTPHGQGNPPKEPKAAP